MAAAEKMAPIADWHKDKEALLADHNSKGEIAAAVKKVKAEVWGEDKPEEMGTPAAKESGQTKPAYTLETKEGEHISGEEQLNGVAYDKFEGKGGKLLIHPDSGGYKHYEPGSLNPVSCFGMSAMF